MAAGPIARCSWPAAYVRCRKGTAKRKAGRLSARTARRRVLRITLSGGGRPGGGGSAGSGLDGSSGGGRVSAADRADFLAAEEPLGIRVNGTALTLTMRTPG